MAIVSDMLRRIGSPHSIRFIPISEALGTPRAFMLLTTKQTDRVFTLEFKDGLGNHVSSYTVKSDRKWRTRIVPISKQDAENPSVCALWTMTGRWELPDRPFHCGMAGDKGELYGCELVITCD